MSTRALLIKNKLISIINELNSDGVTGYKVYIDESKSRSILSDRTNVFPIEEKTRYNYHFEDGMKTKQTGESYYLLGGESFISTKTLDSNNDLAFQRYSLLLSKLEAKLIDYQEFEITNGTGISWVCSIELVESGTDAIANEGRTLFNIKLKVDWKTK